jgi:transcriptional regulator NrdR family protein
MNCPKCDSTNVYVVDSRPLVEFVSRRRHCKDCGHRFNTVEITQEEFTLLTRLQDKIQQIRKVLS